MRLTQEIIRKLIQKEIEEAKLTKAQIKGRDKDAKTIKQSTIDQYGEKEGTRAAFAIATNIQKAKAKKKKK